MTQPIACFRADARGIRFVGGGEACSKARGTHPLALLHWMTHADAATALSEFPDRPWHLPDRDPHYHVLKIQLLPFPQTLRMHRLLVLSGM